VRIRFSHRSDRVLATCEELDRSREAKPSDTREGSKMRKFFGKLGSNVQAGAATVKDVRQGGIGIVLQKDAANRMVVVRLVAGGPAEESGTVLAGDVLQDVGGVEPPAGGWEMADVLALIIGAHGTPVQLGLRRGTSQIRTSIVRQATAAPLQPQVPPPHDAGNAGAGASGAAGQKEQRRQFNLVAPSAQDMAGTSTGSIFKRPTPAQLLKGASPAATATATSRAADAFRELSLGGGGHGSRGGGEKATNAGGGGMPRLEGGADVSQVAGSVVELQEEPDEEAPLPCLSRITLSGSRGSSQCPPSLRSHSATNCQWPPSDLPW
jgi:hypothetical protein